MNLEVSTINVLLGLVVTFQAWIIRELIRLRTRVAILTSHCPHCKLKTISLEEEEAA